MSDNADNEAADGVTRVGTAGPIGTAPAAPISRRRAVVYALLSVASLGGGLGAYSLAPKVEIIGVELGGGRQPWPLPAHVRGSLGWDVALIVGYGGALLFGLLLAKAVFGRAALAEWPLPDQGRTKRRAQHTKHVAWLVGGLATLAVVADLLEDLMLFVATHLHHRNGVLLDAVTGAAVVKFCALLPAAVVAVAGVVVAVFRAKRKAPKTVSDEEAYWPLGKPTDASRWTRGYAVPGLDRTTLAARTEPTVGVCLSGGGVRSASVALGAVQSLRTEVRRARYLVSVSGGGYTAGALQLALTDAVAPGRTSGKPIRDPKTVLMPGTVEEDRVRRHASYIADSAGQLVVALGVLARVLVLSLFVVFGPALVLGYLIGRAYRAVPIVDWVPAALLPSHHLVFPAVRTGALYAIGLLGVLALLVFVAALVAESRTPEPRDSWRGLAGGLVLACLLVAVLAVAVPALVFAAAEVAKHVPGPGTAAASLGSVLLSYAATLVAVGRRGAKTLKGGTFSKVAKALPAGFLSRGLVVLTLFALGAAWLLLVGRTAAVVGQRGTQIAVGVVAALLLVVVGFVDVTALSLHPFYRRRLAGAFAVRRVKLPDQQRVAEGYEYGERTTLSTYAKRYASASDNADDVFPEVIFAAAANLTGEQRAPLNAVGFTFSGGWIGGPDVGYVRTEDLENAVGPQIQSDLTVEAAVAISGAAFASAMGRMGRWYGILLAVTGARLGSWLPNPAYVRRANASAQAKDWTAPRLPALRRLPYLLREVFGVHRCDDRMLQITDGGHYENLGLVELLRRRCRQIYCIDASGDAPPTATTLRQAMTLAHEELGVTFSSSSAWDLVPGSATPLEPAAQLTALNDKMSKSSTLRVTFTYPPESGLPPDKLTGVLIVAKALLTPRMSYDVLARGASDPLFPRDPTSDQFFDDDKYCAYTALGRELGEAAKRAARISMPGQEPPPGAAAPAGAFELLY